MAELNLVKIDGGFRVRETENYWIDVLFMAFGNLRIVTTPKASPGEYHNGWCYNTRNDGRSSGAHSPIEVFLRCFTFDPEIETDCPEGWVKEVVTGRRACGGLFPAGKHRGFIASCEHCANQKAPA